MLRAGDLDAAGFVDLSGDGQLRGLLAGVSDVRDVPAQLGDDADLDVGSALLTGRLGEEGAAEGGENEVVPEIASPAS